jgi:hypothetical protein
VGVVRAVYPTRAGITRRAHGHITRADDSLRQRSQLPQFCYGIQHPHPQDMSLKEKKNYVPLAKKQKKNLSDSLQVLALVASWADQSLCSGLTKH